MKEDHLKSEFLFRLSEFEISLSKLLEKVPSKEGSLISSLFNLVLAVKHIPSKKQTSQYLPEFIYTLVVMNDFINEIIRGIDDHGSLSENLPDKFRNAQDYLLIEYNVKLNITKN